MGFLDTKTGMYAMIGIGLAVSLVIVIIAFINKKRLNIKKQNRLKLYKESALKGNLITVEEQNLANKRISAIDEIKVEAPAKQWNPSAGPRAPLQRPQSPNRPRSPAPARPQSPVQPTPVIVQVQVQPPNEKMNTFQPAVQVQSVDAKAARPSSGMYQIKRTLSGRAV
ncbi:hypothetical protein HDV00_003896 [Rhizophlyctis rosea]|nr:hypothetical protein HDV00_003896 [Rhizophlyctis rosea]